MFLCLSTVRSVILRASARGVVLKLVKSVLDEVRTQHRWVDAVGLFGHVVPKPFGASMRKGPIIDIHFSSSGCI